MLSPIGPQFVSPPTCDGGQYIPSVSFPGTVALDCQCNSIRKEKESYQQYPSPSIATAICNRRRANQSDNTGSRFIDTHAATSGLLGRTAGLRARASSIQSFGMTCPCDHTATRCWKSALAPRLPSATRVKCWRVQFSSRAAVASEMPITPRYCRNFIAAEWHVSFVSSRHLILLSVHLKVTHSLENMNNALDRSVFL